MHNKEVLDVLTSAIQANGLTYNDVDVTAVGGVPDAHTVHMNVKRLNLIALMPLDKALAIIDEVCALAKTEDWDLLESTLRNDLEILIPPDL